MCDDSSMLIKVGIDPDDGLGAGEKNVGSLGWMLLSSSLGPPGWGSRVDSSFGKYPDNGPIIK